MAFSLFCILETIVLLMNAFAILNERFLKHCTLISILTFTIVGLTMDSVSFIPGQSPQ